MTAAMRQVSPGVHAWIQPDGTWWLNNAGVVAGDDGVLVIDTCATAARTERFLSAVAETTGGKPIRLAVNTHHHGDHTYGNSLLPAATVLIGHTLMREGLRDDPIIDGCPPFWHPVPDWGPVTRRLPDVTIESAMTVHLGDRRIDLMHPGRAHTAGDLIAWLPAERVLFSGDLIFAGLTPLVFMGSVPGALRAMDWLATLEPEIVVPGHGPILTGPDIPRVFDDHRRYYHLIQAIADEGRAKGIPPLEAARQADLGEFATWPDAERLVLNLHREYADRATTDMDLIAALTDATTWLGGPMPTTV